MLAVVTLAAFFTLQRINVTPRQLAPYIARRASGHNAGIEILGKQISEALVAADRGDRSPQVFPVSPSPVPTPLSEQPARRTILVSTTKQAAAAIESALPGDIITFLPGRYRFGGQYIAVTRPGTSDAPVQVRAQTLGDVVLEFDMLEGFLVSVPYWSFENLEIHGVCREHSDCEHAFHVVSDAHHFAAVHNELVNFNAHFKINGSGGKYPDFGTLTANILRNDSIRQTGNPVTLIDLVAASHWRVSANRISDFIKGQSDQISYGAFAKGGGVDNRFERNIVICEERLVRAPGQRVGLSLGGGGTAPEACRGRKCVTEQTEASIERNLIAACSDDGIYLNKSALSKIVHNTLLDTGGITARFGETSADVIGNVVDGVLRQYSGATMHAHDNLTTRIQSLYLGMHPLRHLFSDVTTMDLRWRASPPRRSVDERPQRDLCGNVSTAPTAYGAFEDFAGCLITR
jgi:hypothetical protein